MMFSFLTKSNGPAISDKVWQSISACYKGVATDALMAINAKKSPIVFFYFDEQRNGFMKFMESNQLSCKLIGNGFFDEVPLDAVVLAPAFSIDAVETRQWLERRGKATPLMALFLGHYPLVDPEKSLLDKLAILVGDSEVTFGSSMEDILFRQFGADRVKGLMTTLGLKEDECIQHDMVGKALLRARKKLQESVLTEQKANTEKEWFIKNAKQQL